MDGPSTYSPSFFEHEDRELANAANVLAPLIVALCRPSSVLDVGCGTGRLLAAFRAAGVTHITGVEGGWVDRRALKIDSSELELRDLSRPLDLGRRFDLVVCTEVAEHLPSAVSRTLIESLVRHSDLVLFSAAIPFQGGEHHVTERWPPYWFRLFQGQGFHAIDCLRPRLWNDARVPYYYRQNLVLYVRTGSEVDGRLRAALPGPMWPDSPLSLVHPNRHLEVYTSWKGLLNAVILAVLHLTGLRRQEETAPPADPSTAASKRDD